MVFVFQVDSESMVVGKAAIANMLGGIGYFYGQSKISVLKNSKVGSFYLIYVFMSYHFMNFTSW